MTVSPSAKADEGIVIKSSAGTGEMISSENAINIVVSSGLVEIPSVIDLSIEKATARLTGPRYALEVIAEPDPGCAGGLVTKQSLEGEQKQQSKVTLTYCSA